jgi:DNA-binding NarL/FixJ family response regulator
MPLTILLCDDHALFREGLSALLARQPDWRVIAEAADGAEAVRLAREHRPDLAVLDVAMPGVGGVEAAEGIRDASPGTRIVAVSMYGDAHYRKRMLAAGASAYVLKNDASAELIAAIQAVLRGETYVSPALERAQQPSGPARSAEFDLSALTDREMEVFRHLALGRRNREVAEALGISVKTVETHRARLMLKLGITNLAELVKIAIRAGVVGIE